MFPITKKLVEFIGGPLPQDLSMYDVRIRVQDGNGQEAIYTSPHIKYFSATPDNIVIHLESDGIGSTKVQFATENILEIEAIQREG